MSCSLRITSSSPSILTVLLPAYCPKTTKSPSLTDTALTSPLSRVFPGPTARTFPSEGCSAADPGSTIPPSVVCSSEINAPIYGYNPITEKKDILNKRVSNYLLHLINAKFN